MFNKERVKGFMSGFTIAILIFALSITALASPTSKSIEVIYNNIKLVIDGKPVVFGKDSAGKQIEPFTYNGTTYLPVRAVGEAIGKKVDWDASTQTVFLGERPGEISYMTETLEPYNSERLTTYRLNDSNKLSMGGIEYKTGYVLGSYIEGNILFNLNGMYNEISGYIGVYSGKNPKEDYFNIYLDGELYESIKLSYEDLPEQITIPVKGVNQLKITATSNYSGFKEHPKLGFGDPIIK